MNQVFDAYAVYYDLLYQDKDYTGEAIFVSDLLSKYGVVAGEVLDLGCGTGKHAICLADKGHKINGVDMSQAMIEAARANIPERLKNQITYQKGDARTVKLDRKFDAVISLFHVASYQVSNSDIRAMLETAAHHLNTGGVFLFDCWYGPTVLTDRPVIRTKRMNGEGFNILRIAEPTMYPNENVVHVDYTVLVTNEKEQQTQIIRETHRMRYFFSPELEMLLTEAGFKLMSLVEWMSGDELNFNTWSATVIAVRK